MGFISTLEKSLTKFGGNNSPTFVAMSIAAAKGIFRPLFTMSDKKESPETKRYTAMREGLTEIIAIPIYFLSGVVSQKIAKTLANEKNFVSKDVYNKYKTGEMTPEINKAIEHAKDLAKINLPKMKSNAAFIGVCTSALILIPLICSITIKPIMSRLEKKISKKEDKTLTVYDSNKVERAEKLGTFRAYTNIPQYGMKVGGV